ncbi:MAG: hypothetical protein HC932_02375 [Thermales bacterium]|nr:hypothetical protein [Thermales bacterium]
MEIFGNDEFNIVTENIDVGEVQLIIDNPAYDYIQREINLIPGENIIEDI